MPGKDASKKDRYTAMPLMKTDAKILNIILDNTIQPHIKKKHHQDHTGFTPEMQERFSI
jgi:hypothetical protein